MQCSIKCHSSDNRTAKMKLLFALSLLITFVAGRGITDNDKDKGQMPIRDSEPDPQKVNITSGIRIARLANSE
jgi:hypothetical protein